MAVNFASGFNITSNEVVDTRIFKTKAQMLNMTQAELERMPDKYFCMCPDDSQIYFYDKQGSWSPTTGYFTAFDSTVADDIANSTEVKDALEDNIAENLTDSADVQSALGDAVKNSDAVKSGLADAVKNSSAVKQSISDVIGTDEGVQGSIADVVENSPAVQGSIASAIESSPTIQEKIDSSVQSSLESGEVTVPIATTILQGTVVSSADKNKVSVNSTTGIMEVNTIGIEKLGNTTGTLLVIRGGKAPTSI